MLVLEFEEQGYCASLWVTVKPACSKSESKDFNSDFTCLLPLCLLLLKPWPGASPLRRS